MNRYLVDLHVHTALSPCASEEMTPPAIVDLAVRLGLDVIAVSDHNTTKNATAVRRAAADRLVVLAGMEITTAEEVHVLGIFPDEARAAAAGEAVLATLPETAAEIRAFGQQYLMDEQGRILGTEKRLLSGASGLNLAEAVAMVRSFGGLAIPSHIDRPSFGIFSQLGLFPTDVQFDAVEVTTRGLASPQAALYTGVGLPVITSSDSHQLDDLGTSYSMFEMNDATFDEIALTFKGLDGRRIYNSA